MLNLTSRVGESVILTHNGVNIVVKVLRIGTEYSDSPQVCLGFDAPPEVLILREKVLLRKLQKMEMQAVAS